MATDPTLLGTETGDNSEDDDAWGLLDNHVLITLGPRTRRAATLCVAVGFCCLLAAAFTVSQSQVAPSDRDKTPAGIGEFQPAAVARERTPEVIMKNEVGPVPESINILGAAVYVRHRPVWRGALGVVSVQGDLPRHTWIVNLPPSTTQADFDTIVSNYQNLTGGMKLMATGHPDKGGVAFLILQATSVEIEDFIVDNHLGNGTVIEEDAPVAIIPEIAPNTGSEGRRLATQFNPPWGLDRADQKFLPLNLRYTYPDQGGSGVHIYVVDTGIRTTHADFEGRAIPTLETNGLSINVCSPSDVNCAIDRNGHGTHTAGTAAGKTSGIAKKATLHAVKVTADDGTGSTASIGLAVDWIIANGPKPAVISMSLGCVTRCTLISLPLFIKKAYEAGITVVVAAGNNRDDACFYGLPAVPEVIAVAASTPGDSRASFSNFGSCVDIFAPGYIINSADIRSDISYVRLSGTSMSCPHVSGLAAIIYGLQSGLSAAGVKNQIMQFASPGIVFDARGSTNLMMRMLTVAPTPAPTPTPPTRVDTRITVNNVNYAVVSTNNTLESLLTGAIKSSVSSVSKVGEQSIDLLLSSGSVIADATIFPPSTISASDVVSNLNAGLLADTVTANVQAVSGIGVASTGPISTTTQPAVATTAAPTSAPTPAPPVFQAPPRRRFPPGTCFPGEALVRVQGVGTKPVSNLRMGDRVLVRDRFGRTAFERFLGFLHAVWDESTRKSHYLTVVHSQGRLRASPEHLVFVATDGATHQTLDTKTVGALQAGDVLVSVDALHKASAPGALATSVVTSIFSDRSDIGMFAPLTASGTIFVDDVLCSVYANPTSLKMPQRFMHAALFPARTWGAVRHHACDGMWGRYVPSVCHGHPVERGNEHMDPLVSLYYWTLKLDQLAESFAHAGP